MTTDIRFKRNKKSRIRGQILSIFLSLIAICMILFGILIPSNSIILIFMGFLGLGIYLTMRSFNKTDTVIINHDGISSNGNGMGLIEWDFIEGFEIRQAVNTPVLGIQVNDTEKLLNSVKKVSQILMKSNIKRLGNPVVIPQPEFHEPLEVALPRIETFRNRLSRDTKKQ